MFTPTQIQASLPQGGILITNGPFRLICTTEEKAVFELVNEPTWGALELTLTGLQEKCSWTREQLQKMRRNTVYFPHEIKGSNEVYEAFTCWSPGKYTRLQFSPALQEIIDREIAKGNIKLGPIFQF